MTDNLPAQQPRQKQSLLVSMAEKYAMDPGTFQQTIKATVMPPNASNEQMAAFLLVAHQYDLNPVTKEIYAFPAKGGGIQPLVGVDGWINLAQRRSEFDGMEFEFEHDDKGAPVACTCKIFRKDRQRPVSVTEYMDECRRPTEPWKVSPRRMLRHKALIQGIRYAFGFSGIKDEDDVIYTTHTVDESAPAYVSGAERAAQALEHNKSAQAQTIDADRALQNSSHAAPPQKTIQTEAESSTPPESVVEDSGSNEWPKANPDTGELLDVQGCPWIEDVHSSGKTCNQDGFWRRRKGVMPSSAEQAEQRALQQRQQSEPATQPEAKPEQKSDVQVLHYYQENINRAYKTQNADALESTMVAINDDNRLTAQDTDRLTSQITDMLAELE